MPHGIVTLLDAGEYIMTLSKKEQQQQHWQIAIEMLMLAAQDRGPMLHARIGMLKALNHGKAKPPPAPRKKAVRKATIIG